MKFVLLLTLAVSATALSDSYTEGCIKMFLFHTNASDETDKLKAHLKKSCVCQEKELKKRGISDADLAAFTKNAGQAVLDSATMKVTLRINEIIQSPEVKELCQSLVP